MLSSVSVTNAGNYAVMVTNAVGSLTSSNAVLTVEEPPPPTISKPRLNGNTFTISVSTQPGRNHVLEYKNALTDAAWTPVQTKLATGSTVDFTDDTATGAARYYRIRVE